jgi:hypothetical protein
VECVSRFRREEYATGIAGLLGIDAKKKRKTMSTTFRVVVAAALALGSTSAALAASEEARTRTAITWNALRRRSWSKAQGVAAPSWRGCVTDAGGA